MKNNVCSFAIILMLFNFFTCFAMQDQQLKVDFLLQANATNARQELESFMTQLIASTNALANNKRFESEHNTLFNTLAKFYQNHLDALRKEIGADEFSPIPQLPAIIRNLKYEISLLRHLTYKNKHYTHSYNELHTLLGKLIVLKFETLYLYEIVIKGLSSEPHDRAKSAL